LYVVAALPDGTYTPQNKSSVTGVVDVGLGRSTSRLVAEPVLNRTEDFIIGFARLLSRDTKYDYKFLLCLTKDEMTNYFRASRLPKKSILAARDKQSVFLYEDGSAKIFINKRDVAKIEAIVHPKLDAIKVSGQIAFTGKISGIARIVLDPAKIKQFDQGDILIAGSTRPEYLPIMKKAAAFVTDSGGILSHAAIVAREMKKPCIIGTKIATEVLKDGDLVEVNANHGWVRKLK